MTLTRPRLMTLLPRGDEYYVWVYDLDPRSLYGVLRSVLTLALEGTISLSEVRAVMSEVKRNIALEKSR